MQDISPYITNQVHIGTGKIFQKEKLIFDSEERGLAFLQAAYEHLDNEYPKFYKMDALCKLGTIAASVLLHTFNKSLYQPEEVGIVLSNRNGSIEADVNYFESAQTFPSPSLFVYTLPNIIMGEISIRNGFKGENAFFISEKFDADWIHFYVLDLMQHHGIKACICGWADVINEESNAHFFLVEKENKNGITFTPRNLVQQPALET